MALRVHIYSDSIFKYVPNYVEAEDFCVEFFPVIKRGATVKAIDEDLSRFGPLRGLHIFVVD